MSDYTVVGPLAYRGKENCDSVICTRRTWQDENGKLQFEPACIGWHCSYCDQPCSSQGHGCDAAQAILGEARRALRGES